MNKPRFSHALAEIIPIAMFLMMDVSAAQVFKQPVDTIQWGHSGSTANKSLVFDFGLGSSNPSCYVDNSTHSLWFNENSFELGDGTTANKQIYANTGAGSPPLIRWNNSATSWQFSNDGVTFSNFGSGSSSMSANIQQLEQKAENEHFGIFTDQLDDSVTSGFVNQPPTYFLNGALMENATGGSNSIVPVWAPVFLNSSDKNTSSTTNWSLGSNASTLTTSATRQIGTASISATKTTGGTTSLIEYNYGSATLNVSSNTDLWFWIKSSPASGVSNVEVVIDIDGTNEQIFTPTTQYNGNAFASGWNLINVNISTGGTAAGTGWNPALGFQYAHFGVVTSSSSTTLTYLLNGIFFSTASPSNYIPLGSEITFYDNANRETQNIDAGNTTVVGGSVVTTNNLTNSYTGGFGTSSVVLSRNTMSIGSNQSAMQTTDQYGNTLSGNILYTQENRLNTVLRDSASSSTVHGFADINTPQVYSVVSSTSTTIVLSDPSNTSLDLLSGDDVHVFKTYYNANGKKNFVYVGDMTLSTNSSYNGSLLQTTITCSGGGCVPAGTTTGYYVAKNHVTASYALETPGTNELFSSLPLMSSPDGILLYDTGLPIPNPSTVYAYWPLGSMNGYANSLGIGPTLTINGTLNDQASFKNGQTANTGWTTSNFLEDVGSSSVFASPSIMTVSFWVYISAIGNTNFEVSNVSTTNISSNGWAVLVNNTPNYCLSNWGASIACAGTPTVGWHFLVFNHQNGVSNGDTLWVDGIKIITTTWSFGTSGVTDFVIGNHNDSPNVGDHIAQVLVWLGSNLSGSQIQLMYNSGLAQVLGFGPRIKYRYSVSSASGQSLSEKIQVSRHTTSVVPFLGKIGIITP